MCELLLLEGDYSRCSQSTYYVPGLLSGPFLASQACISKEGTGGEQLHRHSCLGGRGSEAGPGPDAGDAGGWLSPCCALKRISVCLLHSK